MLIAFLAYSNVSIPVSLKFMDRKVLDILVCPLTRQPLIPLKAEQIQSFNQTVGLGKVKKDDGTVVTESISSGFITRDGKTLYRSIDGIPALLPEEGINTTQLEFSAAAPTPLA